MTTASVEWSLWSTTARLVLTSPLARDAARAVADRVLADVEAACSRFRPDSELRAIEAALPSGVEVSGLLAQLISRALLAAELTDGDVDPTLGQALDAVGYDRDIRLIVDSETVVRAVASPVPGWRSVSLRNRQLSLPAGMTFDLGASAKAVAADLVAAAVLRETGSGVLVELGGDIATAGAAPDGGWTVLVQDLDGDPAATVSLPSGMALATSSTQKRNWVRGGTRVHHILDPRTGLPAEPVWRTVSAAAASCLIANAMTTASIVRGEAAPTWLESQGIAARLVHRDGSIRLTGGWPVEPVPAREPAHV